MARSSMQREKHLVIDCLARSTPSQPSNHTRHQPPIAQWACESPLGLSCRHQQARSTHAAHACAASHLAGDQTTSGQTQWRPVRRTVLRERWRKPEEDPDGACSGAGCRGCGYDWAPWGSQDRRLTEYSDYMTFLQSDCLTSVVVVITILQLQIYVALGVIESYPELGQLLCACVHAEP